MSEYANIKSANFNFVVQDPEDLKDVEWREIQMLQRASLDTVHMSVWGKREEQEIDHFVGWSRPEAFKETRVDPRVGIFSTYENLPAGFNYRDPIVARAYQGSMLVGEAWSANRYSTSPPIKSILRPLGIYKPEAWLREVYVLPDFRHQRVASNMLALMFGEEVQASNKRFPGQTVSIDVLEDIPDLTLIAEKHGFIPRSAETAHAFGPASMSPESTRTRMEHKTLGQLAFTLVNPMQENFDVIIG